MWAAWRFEKALKNSEKSSRSNTSFIERLNLAIRHLVKLFKIWLDLELAIVSWSVQGTMRRRPNRVAFCYSGAGASAVKQYHQGVRVFGGQLVWQKQSGLVLSATGNIYEAVDVGVTPTLTVAEAEARVLALEGPEAFIVGETELVILPLTDRYALAYYVRTRSPGALQVHSRCRLSTPIRASDFSRGTIYILNMRALASGSAHGETGRR